MEAYHSLWHQIRSKTIDLLAKNKKNIKSIVRDAPIAGIAASYYVSMTVCGGLVITGIALAPITLGGSLALFVLGGVFGGLTGAAGGIGAAIVGIVLANKELKKAQQHISLDQQLSLSINKVADMYSEMMHNKPQHAAAFEEAVGGVQDLETFIGAEGTVEASAAIHSTDHTANEMALAGATLAVTVPIDISSIAYNSYHIHKAKQDETEKTEKNKVKWLQNEIEKLFRGTIKCKIKQSVSNIQLSCRNVLRNQ